MLFRRQCMEPAGFSLIELLVVVAIVGLLLAMLLPAVQAARESARRVTCANNLRQVGRALHAYHDVQQTFPPGGIEWRPGGDLSRRQLGWAVFLLRHLDQARLHGQVDWSAAFDSPKNAPAAATVLACFLCPSTPRSSPLVEGRGGCDYGGIFGERILSPNKPPRGMMIYDTAFSVAEVLDGTTHTLAIGEDAGWPDGQWINGRTIFDQAYPVNAAPPFENDLRSEHPRGAHGLFADGSVRFLHDETSLSVLAAICTRAGNDSAGNY